jgi:hypothetical protein
LAPVGWQEPDESRGSRPDLWEPGGEIPPGHPAADGQSMTVADVVAKAMDGRLEDFVREAVALVARLLMEGEISAEIGAALGEVAPETRLTHRNGVHRRT